ncbi:lasso peptide biosynthesis B2 protein [Luteimonas sp. R10]|uniref:lasso peptide biosynthesis B2 protein n=1 Tax=Luteimonas sp. R10 TaxID=3108176 RepID=UPI0030930462|nr:lasso peptide biosynthesis B2 protein [Luteimonas sp. R10]
MPYTYALSEQMSFCDFSGRLVFLDIANDRYFQLPMETERLFRRYIRAGDDPDTDIGPLMESGILAQNPGNPDHFRTPHFEPVTRSALEQDWSQARRADATAVPRVFAIVTATWIQLRTTSLKNVLDGIATHRRRRTALPGIHAARDEDKRISLASMKFRQARPFVPIQTSCLLDSVSLARFLISQHHYPTIVFGVTNFPFSAHCWVQFGDLALSDFVGNVNAYTPIMEIR